MTVATVGYIAKAVRVHIIQWRIITAINAEMRKIERKKSMDSCMYDPFDQCFHNCPKCPQKDKHESDEDYQRDYGREEKYYD